jgi:hypothetical protein
VLGNSLKHSTVFGLAAMVLGGCWLVPFILPLSAMRSPDILGVLFWLFFMPILLLPGAFAMYFGYRLMRRPDETSIKQGVGSLAVLVTLFIGFAVPSLLPETLEEQVPTGLFLLPAAVLVLPLYAVVARHLLRREGLEVPGGLRIFGRTGVFLIALLIFSEGSALAGLHHPLQEPTFWSGVVFFSPIVAALAFYKLGLYWVGASPRKRRPFRLQTTEHPPTWAGKTKTPLNRDTPAIPPPESLPR